MLAQAICLPMMTTIQSEAKDLETRVVRCLNFTPRYLDLPTFFGNSYSVVKGFTDRMINVCDWPELINARITLPLNFELHEDRNLLTKILKYK